MPRYRFVPYKENDLSVQKVNPWWLRLFTFGVVPKYQLLTTLRASEYSMIWNLISDVEKFKKKLAVLKELSDRIDREVEDAKSRLTIDRFGISDEFELSEKDAKDMFKTFADPPDTQLLLQFLNPRVIQEYALGRKPKAHHSGHSNRPAGISSERGHNSRPVAPGNSGETSLVMLQEHAQKSAIHLAEERGANEVYAFREDKPGDGKGDRKAQFKKLRQDYPQRQGESQGDWDKRINRMLDDKEEGR